MTDNSSLPAKIARGALVVSFALGLTLPLAYQAIGEKKPEEPPENGVGMSDLENPVQELPVGTDGQVAGIQVPESFSRVEPLFYTAYRVQKGDMIGTIAERFGLNQDTLVSFNGIKNSRLLQIGQFLRIPNQDGILYTVKPKDTLAGIGEAYEADTATISYANGFQVDTPAPETRLFIPGARMASVDLQEINGDLFIWPVRGWVTSPYGYRTSPFTGARQFHSGIDIGAALGTPIKAAMAGRVSSTGYDINSGNYVVVSHHSGYRTFYGHLNVIRVETGGYVKTGDRIGDVGSTGLSTGSHLHFTVFKNGVTVNPRNLMK